MNRILYILLFLPTFLSAQYGVIALDSAYNSNQAGQGLLWDGAKARLQWVDSLILSEPFDFDDNAIDELSLNEALKAIDLRFDQLAQGLPDNTIVQETAPFLHENSNVAKELAFWKIDTGIESHQLEAFGYILNATGANRYMFLSVEVNGVEVYSDRTGAIATNTTRKQPYILRIFVSKGLTGSVIQGRWSMNDNSAATIGYGDIASDEVEGDAVFRAETTDTELKIKVRVRFTQAQPQLKFILDFLNIKIL